MKNQIILDELPFDYSNKDNIENDLTQGREWLLKRLQRTVIEYNARPYQRYSLAAIRNLADFASDDGIRTAARNVLDLSAAKMALGSNQGRRFVPYRRLMEELQKFIVGYDKNGKAVFNGLFDLFSGADHQIGLMLAYTGQTQQAPFGKITPAAINDMTFAVTSNYSPPEAILDLAVNKKTPYQQYIKHDAAEIYSSTEGYLLTAGGIQSGPSSTIELQGLSIGNSILGVIPLSRNNDRGAAIPTTLMLSAGNNRSSLEAFMRIEGPRQKYDDEKVSYDHNLCVYKGFACGLNIQIPTDMEHCFVQNPPDGKWRFFHSKQCAPFINGSPVMIALYKEDCQGDQTGDCTKNLGLFEAVNNPIDAVKKQPMDFETFQKHILDRNQSTNQWSSRHGALLSPKRKILSGTYTSFTGEEIIFNTSGHQLDSNRTGIVSVNGHIPLEISEWPRATGNILGVRERGEKEVLSINGKTGLCTFTNPNTAHGFNIIMSEWDNPQRRDF